MSNAWADIARRVDGQGVTNIQHSMWLNGVKWTKELFGVTLWEKQQEVFESVVRNKATTVRSGHGVGKTKLVACTCVLFLLSHYPSYVVTTSAGWRGLEKVLWPEITSTINRANRGILNAAGQHEGLPLGDSPLALEWEPVRGNHRWRMVAVASKDKNNFAGFHNAYVLVIGDEADGIAQDIFEAIDGNTTGPNDRKLYTGNPHTTNGPFHQTFKSPDFHKIRISCYDHPNVREGRDVIPGMVTRDWVRMMERRYGRNSGVFQARVLGNFPELSEDMLVPYSWIVQATQEAMPVNFDRASGIMAVDVARSASGDKTVMIVRDDRAIFRHFEYRGLNTMGCVGQIQANLKSCRLHGIEPRTLVIDDTGIGGGVVDRLKELENELTKLGIDNLVPFVGAASASDPMHFINSRAEAYWNLREHLDPTSGTKFHIPERMLDTFSELAQIRLQPNSSDRIAIMPKDKMIEQGFILHSTDDSDTLSMTFAPVRNSGFRTSKIDMTGFGRGAR